MEKYTIANVVEESDVDNDFLAKFLDVESLKSDQFEQNVNDCKKEIFELIKNWTYSKETFSIQNIIEYLYEELKYSYYKIGAIFMSSWYKNKALFFFENHADWLDDGDAVAYYNYIITTYIDQPDVRIWWYEQMKQYVLEDFSKRDVMINYWQWAVYQALWDIDNAIKCFDVCEEHLHHLRTDETKELYIVEFLCSYVRIELELDLDYKDMVWGEAEEIFLNNARERIRKAKNVTTDSTLLWLISYHEWLIEERSWSTIRWSYLLERSLNTPHSQIVEATLHSAENYFNAWKFDSTALTLNRFAQKTSENSSQFLIRWKDYFSFLYMRAESSFQIWHYKTALRNFEKIIEGFDSYNKEEKD